MRFSAACGFDLRAASVFVTVLAAALALSAGQASANHVSCGDTITQDTTLDSDLIDCAGDGIVIGADNITLDLNGHTVDGVVPCCFTSGSENGIDNTAGHASVTVEGGIVQQFGTGVGLNLARHNLLRGLQLLDNRGPGGLQLAFDPAQVGGGIVLETSFETRVEENLFSGSQRGLAIGGGSSGNGVARNEGSANAEADAYLLLADNNLLIRNKFTSRGGISLRDSTGNAVDRNWISSSDPFSEIGIGVGARLFGSDNNEITRNRVIGYRSYGVAISGSDRNLLSENTIADNETGVRLQGGGLAPYLALDNRIVGNTLERNATDGIAVCCSEETRGTIVDGNQADRNADDGIDVRNADTTLTDNKVRKNGDLGIEAVEGVIDGGGNHAFGNGNPLQCLNVVCK